ncbi:MAG: hypothetical protein EA397_02705 [Deltaproteobacteria bacterium]|nr:MAG: hypothetical protein EA397_02705 [Deltaproteobacteria bacterium]
MHRLLLALTLLLAPLAHSAEPFTVSTLSKAQAHAASDGKLVVVYLFHDQSPDCAFMDKDTWNHPEVRGWIAKNGVAARVDAQSGHGAMLKSRYQVDGTPSVLAFQGDDLVKRHTGLLDATSLVSWLDAARNGSSTEPMSAASAESTAPAVNLDLDKLTVRALSAGNPEDRAKALLETWTLTVGTPQQEMRREPLITALGPVVKESFGASERVTVVRNASWSRWKKHGILADLIDWIALNSLLEEEPATLRWLDERKPPDCHPAAQAALKHLHNPLLDMLIRRERWATLGACVEDAEELVGLYQADWQNTLDSGQLLTDRNIQAHRTRLSGLSAGLLAAGRDRDARRVARALLTHDERAGPAIVETALTAEQPRGWHRRMLDPRKQDEKDLSITLNKAIKLR